MTRRFFQKNGLSVVTALTAMVLSGCQGSLPSSTVQPGPNASATTQSVDASQQSNQQASITNVEMSDAITSEGDAVNPKTDFPATAKTIYTVLTLQNAKKTTALSYIRYYDGKYVDSKVSHPNKDGVTYFYFQSVLKAGQTRKKGQYSIVTYVDGKKALTVNYRID